MNSNEVFLETADRIAAVLCRDAVWDGDRCTWLGDSMEYIDFQPKVVHQALGPEVYGGTSGIALFLAKCFSYTKDRIFRSVAEGAIHQALARADELPHQTQTSFYSGILGVAYAAIEVGSALNSPELVERGLSLSRRCCVVKASEQMLDVISGCGSGIPVFLHLYKGFHDSQFLTAAVSLGEQIVNQADQKEEGWSWQTSAPSEASRNLCGYGHGTAGIGLALLELHAVTKCSRFLEGANEAFDYEKTHFDVGEQNYPDFRLSPQARKSAGPSFMAAWCHGAPGIALSRIRAYELTRVEQYRDEADIALQSTIRSLSKINGNYQSNYSLCHGIGGNASILLYASRVFPHDEYRRMAIDAGLSGIEHYPKSRVPWTCGIQHGGRTPNLMLGTAGVGYFYLNLYSSEVNVPLLIQ